MTKLFWFPTPLDSTGTLRHDADGIVRVAKPDTHPTGRAGISWELSDTWPDKNGARVTISHAADYYDTTFRGVLDLHYFPNGLAGLLVDDCTLTKKPAPCPDPSPIPPPTPLPTDPVGIIQRVYATGQYNLATKAGCGQFTEACCAALHTQHSSWWMHIRKFPPQNHYPEVPYVPGGPVHAVDAIQLLQATADTAAAIYDIVLDSESPNAGPAFNSKGTPDPNLAYYPAK